MKEYKYSKKSIITFFVDVIVLSAVTDVFICRGGPDWLYLVLMWIPAIAAAAAICMNIAEKDKPFSLKKFNNYIGIRKCKLRYILMGILLPLIYLLIPYLIYWKMYPDNFAYSGVSIWIILKDCLPIGILGVFINLLSATGEELGWRGFMVPSLFERLGLNKTLAISSFFWCLWHFPLLIGGGYMEGTPLAYQLMAFVLCIFPVGVIAGILALESRSVWPCAFLHAAHNNFDQGVFGVITKGDNMMYFVSETGVFTIICAWILAIIMYVRFKNKVMEKEQDTPAPSEGE